MESKPALFSTLPIIRHSFATPVTNILLNTEIAVHNQAHPGNSSDVYLRRILLNARYLRSLLTLSDHAQPEVFSPKTALEELIALNEGSLLKEKLVSRIFLKAHTRLVGNKLAFQEITTCLLNNAYESYKHTQPHKLVYLSAVEEKSALVVSIVDGGQGMNWLTQWLSFTPKYTTKRDHTGLGLSFAKSTLENVFQGSFHLRSKPHRGTTIVLRFPLMKRQPIAKPSASLEY